MDGFIYYRPPVPAEDLEEIHELLRAADVFVPSFPPSEADPYHVMTYVEQDLQYKTKFFLLVDRNVVTRWIGLLNRGPLTAAHRLAAGILTFAQSADLMIEPNIALYELGATAGNTAAQLELAEFRIADNIHPKEWCDIALGRADVIVSKVPRRSKAGRKGNNLSAPLYRWQRNYILALKIAELHLAGGPSESRMRKLLQWMYEDFLIGGPAVLLASHYFAPGISRRRLFKSIESADRDRALSGIRNAAWDLTLVSEWLRHIQRQVEPGSDRPLVILCSFDEGVKRLARSIVHYNHPTTSDAEYITQRFQEIWGTEVGQRLAALLAQFQETADNPQRQLHRNAAPDFITSLINEGEEKVRAWRPSRRQG